MNIKFKKKERNIRKITLLIHLCPFFKYNFILYFILIFNLIVAFIFYKVL